MRNLKLLCAKGCSSEGMAVFYLRYLTTAGFIVPLAGLWNRLPESGLNSLFFSGCFEEVILMQALLVLAWALETPLSNTNDDAIQ